MATAIALTVGGCNKIGVSTPEARPVRTVTVEHGAEGEVVTKFGFSIPVAIAATLAVGALILETAVEVLGGSGGSVFSRA
jgi:hypothetical protein